MNVTSEVNASSRVGEIATSHPLATRVFARHGIDFCCGGGVALGDACAKRGLDTAAVLTEIERTIKELKKSGADAIDEAGREARQRAEELAAKQSAELERLDREESNVRKRAATPSAAKREAPIAVGVTNNSPFLQELIDAGPARFGVNFISERSTFQSGETGGWSGLNVAKVSVMQAPPLYHTTGEVLDVISTPGLERIARFLASFVAAADRAPRARINP